MREAVNQLTTNLFMNYEHLRRGRGRPIGPIRRKRNSPAESLGAVITELRTARRWSQSELGKRSSSSKKFISRVERGRQSPTLPFLVRVAQAFGIRTSRLLALAEKKRPRR